jgi:GMP synthase PP-ATPase subunit
VIESAGSEFKHFKSHNNVGGLVEDKRTVRR